MKKFNLEDKDYKNVIIKDTNEILSQYCSISSILGLKDVRIHHEKLESGKRSSFPHFHTKMEEIFIILSGTPTLYLSGESIELKPNDVVYFEPNNNQYHSLENQTLSEVSYIIIAKNYNEDLVPRQKV